MNTPWKIAIVWLAYAALMPTFAESTRTLDLRTYLEATLQYHLTQQEHDALSTAEAISLKDGKRYYWPDITAHTDYDEVTDETAASKAAPASQTIKSGVTTGLDTTWTSWLGTDLTLGLEHQYGRQLGKVSQGIPEDEMQAHNLSVEVSQPLLKDNTLFENRLPLHRARSEWRQYNVEGDLNRLTVLKNAMLDYLAVQEAHDRLQIQQDKLEHTRYLAEVTEALVQEESSLAIDRDLARLDVLRQQQAVANARLTVRQNQQTLTLPWVRDVAVEVHPLPSTKALIDRLMPVLDEEARATRHPEYRQQQLTLDSAELEEKAVRRDRWPDLSVYYRYEKDYREVLPDEESQAWGLRFSYALFDRPAREQQARRRAEATIARWNADDRLKRLEWETTRLEQTVDTLLDELDLQNQSLTLSQRALDHELARYEEGLSSYTDVKNRQQDQLDRQLEALTTQSDLAQALIELAYYRQWDWLDRLP